MRQEDNPNLKYPHYMGLGGIVNQNPIRVSIFNKGKWVFKSQKKHILINKL